MQARDFKSATTKPAADGSRSRKGTGMPPLLTGIIIGLLLGIMLALVVAIWLNRANTPFLDKSPPVSALPTIAARPSPPPVTKSEKNEPEKPRFEFYQILPGDKGSSTTDRKAAVAAKPAPAPDPKAAAKTDGGVTREPPKPAGEETVYLQAGAFQSETDAENLKAKIAFSGFEANVRAVNVRDKGTLYRVRLGPYKNSAEVNRIKASLSQNGINATVVKAGD